MISRVWIMGVEAWKLKYLPYLLEPALQNSNKNVTLQENLLNFQCKNILCVIHLSHFVAFLLAHSLWNKSHIQNVVKRCQKKLKLPNRDLCDDIHCKEKSIGMLLLIINVRHLIQFYCHRCIKSIF